MHHSRYKTVWIFCGNSSRKTRHTASRWIRRRCDRHGAQTVRPEADALQRHPFTLVGLPDPEAWLVSTDPHAQTYVTVSNDEVAAVVVKSTSFRDKFRKSIKSISHKLQILGGSRSRSRSIGESDGVL